MKLFRDNDPAQCFTMSEDEVLQQFVNSKRYADRSREVKVRLALFIAADEPDGLQSTFLGFQFIKLWDYWCANKHKFIKSKLVK